MGLMETFPEDWHRALFIVAHPDDPEYGAAAAVARWTDLGKEVTYLLVTRGEAGIDAMAPDESGPLRAQEQVRAAAVVGVDTVEFLDGHQDGVIEYGVPLRRDLALAIRRHQPELVLGLNPRTTWPGGVLNMADHTAVGQAIPDACRDAANRWVFNDQLVDGLEPWAGVRRVAFTASPEAGHGVDVTDTWERGEQSLAQHRVYLDSVGAPEFLRPMAEHTGAELGCDLAAAWELIEI
jgi:LmbE family N-acetylglucosaminyl deacetylase